VKILFIDEHIIVCDKQAGELSEGEGRNSLPTRISERLADIGEKNTQVLTVHRLDKETSGVIVFARDSASAAALCKSIQDGSFKKQYLSVLTGIPERESDTLRDLLFYDRKRGKSFVVDRKRAGVKQAELDYTVLCHTDDLALVSVTLRTGRTHQIRVQFASRTLPLVGDRRYGAPRSDAPSVALVSCKLSFPHPSSKERLEFTANVPNAFPWLLFVGKFNKTLDNM